MKRVEAATGAVGAGAAITAPNPDAFGSYLATHGIGLLSYAEIMQIAGTAWVLILIGKTVWKVVRDIKKRRSS